MVTLLRPLLCLSLLLSGLVSPAQTLLQKADGNVPVLTNGVTLGVDITRPNASIYYLRPKIDTVQTKEYQVQVEVNNTQLFNGNVKVPVVGERLFGFYSSVTNDDDKANTFALFGSGNLKPKVKAGFLIGRTKDLVEESSMLPFAKVDLYRNLIDRLKTKIQAEFAKENPNLQAVERDTAIQNKLQREREIMLSRLPEGPLITRTWYVGPNVSTTSFNYLGSSQLSKFTTSLVEDSLAVAVDVTGGVNYHIGRDWLIGVSASPGYTNNLSTLKSKSYTRKDIYKNDSLSVETSKSYNAVTGTYRRYWNLPLRLDVLYNIPISRVDSVAALLVYAGLDFTRPTNINIDKIIAEQFNIVAGLYLFTGRKQRFVGGLQFGVQDIGNNGYWLKVRTDPKAELKSFGDRFTISIVGRIALARLGGLNQYFNSLKALN